MKADPGLAEQVRINVINNAADALAGVKDPLITLSVQSRDGRTAILVADNGKGVDAALADQIFVPFFTTRKKGSGIGLSLCRQIMCRYGGSISLRSYPGQEPVCIPEFFR